MLSQQSNRTLKLAQEMEDQELIDGLFKYPEVFNAQPYMIQISMGLSNIVSYLYINDKNKTYTDEEMTDAQKGNNRRYTNR